VGFSLRSLDVRLYWQRPYDAKSAGSCGLTNGGYEPQLILREAEYIEKMMNFLWLADLLFRKDRHLMRIRGRHKNLGMPFLHINNTGPGRACRQGGTV
jgi:hypothetical protein